MTKLIICRVIIRLSAGYLRLAGQIYKTFSGLQIVLAFRLILKNLYKSSPFTIGALEYFFVIDDLVYACRKAHIEEQLLQLAASHALWAFFIFHAHSFVQKSLQCPSDRNVCQGSGA